ncbi:MAG: hypothetical protein M1142_05415 [Patescibacteria group bacterium]|nr:hypothetical protein [Patescibacteria group bacterium]
MEFLKPYFEGTRAILQWGPQGGICNYSLEEIPHDVPTRMWGFFGIYPDLPYLEGKGKGMFLAFATDPNKDSERIRKKILAQKLPERIRNLSVKRNDALKMRYELICARLSAPSMLIAAGERVQTREDVLTLFTVSGIIPEYALQTIQERIKEALAKQN